MGSFDFFAKVKIKLEDSCGELQIMYFKMGGSRFDFKAVCC